MNDNENKTPIETIEHNGKTIEIHYSDGECELSPRYWDNMSVFAFFHRNFSNESDIDHNDHPTLSEMQSFIESRHGLDAICLPVYLYSHGGDTVSTTPFSCPFDSGQLGFAYITREKAREEYGWKRISPKREKFLLEVIESEVKEYDQFLTGEVYGYIVKDSEGNELFSAWDYYDKEECIRQAKSEVPSVEEVTA